MKFWKLAAVTTALVLSTATNAAIVNIGFGEPALAGQYFLDGELVTSDPVQIGTTGLNGAADIITPPANYASGPNEGSAYLHSSIYSSIFIQANGTGVFNLMNLELGEYSSFSLNSTVAITGYLNDGGQVTTTLSLDGIFDGLGGTNDFQLFTFDSSWNNLTRVEFDSTAYSLDNIQLDVNPVPVPAAVWLFGSGLIGLAGFARRKKV